MGIAVLEGSVLVYYSVETIKKVSSPHARLRQGRKIVSRLIADFRPSVLAMEKTFFAKSRNVALLNVLADEITALALRRGLVIVSLAPNAVKKAVAGDGWASKEDVAKAVIGRYPELTTYLAPSRKWKERRQLNMFDAIALGLAYLDSRNACQRRTPRRRLSVA